MVVMRKICASEGNRTLGLWNERPKQNVAHNVQFSYHPPLTVSNMTKAAVILVLHQVADSW
jgi:hypothetical protein